MSGLDNSSRSTKATTVCPSDCVLGNIKTKVRKGLSGWALGCLENPDSHVLDKTKGKPGHNCLYQRLNNWMGAPPSFFGGVRRGEPNPAPSSVEPLKARHRSQQDRLKCCASYSKRMEYI